MISLCFRLLPCEVSSKFSDITEEFIVDRIQQQMLADSEFSLLRDNLRHVLSHDTESNERSSVPEMDAVDGCSSNDA